MIANSIRTTRWSRRRSPDLGYAHDSHPSCRWCLHCPHQRPAGHEHGIHSDASRQMLVGTAVRERYRLSVFTKLPVERIQQKSRALEGRAAEHGNIRQIGRSANCMRQQYLAGRGRGWQKGSAKDLQAR